MHKDVNPAWGYWAEAGGCLRETLMAGRRREGVGPQLGPGASLGVLGLPPEVQPAGRGLGPCVPREYVTGHPCLHGYLLLIPYCARAYDIILFTPHATL